MDFTIEFLATCLMFLYIASIGCSTIRAGEHTLFIDCMDATVLICQIEQNI